MLSVGRLKPSSGRAGDDQVGARNRLTGGLGGGQRACLDADALGDGGATAAVLPQWDS